MINQIKTILLLGILTALMLVAGNLLGGTQGLTIALVFVLIMNGVSYFFSDKIVLMMYRAKEIKKNQLPWLHLMIKEICREAKIPEPKGIYLIPTEQSNAMCTGRGPKHYVIAITNGILSLLSKEELKGVLAHEIAHSKNRDVLITTIASVIAGVISYLAQMAQWAAIFGGGSRDREGGNVIGLLVLAIITPILALIIQLAISRSREYLADETGSRLIKDSKSLSNALVKIHNSVKSHPMSFGSKAGSSLFIENPFKSSGLLNLLSTHPSLESRLERLKNMKI